MLADKNLLKKIIKVGPGGTKCSCCFPPPGKRKEIFRQAKRKLNRELDKIDKES